MDASAEQPQTPVEAQLLTYSVAGDEYGLATLALRLIGLFLLLEAVGAAAYALISLPLELLGFRSFSGFGAGSDWSFYLIILIQPAVTAVIGTLLLITAPRFARWLRMGAAMPDQFPLRQLAVVAVAVVGLIWLAYGIGELIPALLSAAGVSSDYAANFYAYDSGMSRPFDFAQFLEQFGGPLSTLLIGVVLLFGAKRIVGMLKITDS